MPKTKCSKEAFEQKLLARLSKQTSSLPLNLIKLCVKTYAGNRPRDWCNNKALKEKRSLAKKLFKTDENPVLLEYTLNKYIKKQYGGRITLREAYAQGGVLKHQVLLLKYNDYSIVTGFDLGYWAGEMRVGFYIYDSFKIESGGKVILEDPLENPQDSSRVAGLAVKGPNAQLINHGEIIMNNSIKATTEAFGILCENNSTCINLGTIQFENDISLGPEFANASLMPAVKCIANYSSNLNNSGSIIFKGSIIGSVGRENKRGVGVLCQLGGKINNSGTIIFERDFKFQYSVWCVVGTNIENSGTINFNGDIVSVFYGVTGLFGDIENSGSINFKGILKGIFTTAINSFSLNNSGTINFESDIVSDNTVGVYDGNIENSGSINFKGILNGNDGNGSGIYNCSLNNIGTINFESDINGKLPVVGIYAFNRTIINSGTINFKGALNSIEGTCDGVRVNSGKVDNSGDINFKDEITSQDNEVRGILLFNILNNSGNINFENRLYAFNSAQLNTGAVGIDVTSFGYFTNSGNINFNGIINEFGITIPNRNDNGMTLNENSLISFNSDVTFDPDPPAYIIGNGEIIYDTGNTDTDKTYYPLMNINLGGV